MIVCPESSFHEMESIVTDHFRAYRKMYWHLSGGVKFHHPDQIRMRQLLRRSKAWATNQPPPDEEGISSVASGEINTWTDRISIHINGSPYEGEQSSLLKTKDDIHAGISDVFARWQVESARSFDDWFTEECGGFGKGYLQVFEKHIMQLARIASGEAETDMRTVFPPSAVTTIQMMLRQFEELGVPQDRSLVAVADFLFSPSVSLVPFVRITSLMYAAIAFRAAKSGKKKPPGPGAWIDINSISLLLPYCHAIFVDNECRSLLQEPAVREKMNYGTKVFSRSNRQEFMTYLDEIENSATKEHLEAVREVYGDDWPTPYTTMYHDKLSD